MTRLAFALDISDSIRELLTHLNGYPLETENLGFQPSLLRYKVRKKKHIQGKKRENEYGPVGTNDETIVSKLIAVDSTRTYYDDDDWLGPKEKVSKRLGDSVKLESGERKREIEQAMMAWWKKANIGDHVSDAVAALSPLTLDPSLRKSGYGVKFDLYTNRTSPGWHQDWDDGHALFVALVNLSKHGGREVAIKGTEILDFTQDASNAFSELTLQNAGCSVQRKQLMTCKLYERDDLAKLTEDQPFGEIRWFNDAVLVHRTPPYAVNTLTRGSYDLTELNKDVSVNGAGSNNMPFGKLQDEHKDGTRYDFNGPAPVTGRALLRITVRERRRHQNT